MDYRIRAVLQSPKVIRWAYQRVRRGWDDRAVWSLDHHLARTLGAQLLFMSVNVPGYPCDGVWTFEKWTDELERHGNALTVYGDADSVECETEAVYEPAQEALRWVAENLGALWT